CPKCHAPDQYGDVCEKCNATHSTTELIDPFCAVCGTPPVKKKSDHYFFKLSAFAEKLQAWFDSNRSLQPEIKHYLENWIKEGLQDWDISRDGPYFGFKIPGEEDKYYYVWLDAPIGYISSFTHAIGGNISQGEKRWNSSKITHFIGKDIIYFHFLFWPAMLEAADFKLPESIVVHGFLTVNGEKMSKSRGTFFTAEEFASKYLPEFLRFYYAKSLSKKLADINLDFKDFHETVNNELVGNIANYCYRALSFANRFLSSEVGEKAKEPKLEKEILEKVETIKKAYGSLNFNEAVKEILAIADLGNQYFQKNEPWKLVKEDKVSAQKIVALSLNIVKILSILISPILPGFAKELQSIEEKITEERFPLDLKVGKILEAKDHPDAEKLYILQVDLGNEKRQLVAGLKGHYQKEALLNKKIIVVANLKPAKLRGILSSGMLLAADDGKTVEVLEPEGSPGDKVTCGDAGNSPKTISFEDFMKLTILVENHHVICNNNPLKVKGKMVSVNKTGDGAKVR
ncbi:methionine--tRNA ligase, partial [Candidatus Woesearchaeota archaeon]|nr:methionine--tRNA ligase [Candidatus Woesearchaeota archaeon]